jgi:hypothetical protein
MKVWCVSDSSTEFCSTPHAQLEVDSTKINKFYTDKYNSLN